MDKDVIKEVEGIVSTDDIAKDILRVLRDISLSEEEVMAQIMVLITRRDDKLTNYAFKLGKASK